MIKRRTRVMTEAEIEAIMAPRAPRDTPLPAAQAREDAIDRLARTPLPDRHQIGHNGPKGIRWKAP